MRVDKIDARTEKRILMGMVTQTEILGRISLRWAPGLFRSKWAEMIGGWAVKHYQKYETAPGKEIQGHFERWTKKARDEKLIKLVEDFLTELSQEFEDIVEDINPEYILDMAGEYFNLVMMEKLSEDLQDDIDEGRGNEAIARVEGFRRLEIGRGAGITLEDEDAIDAAFNDKHDSILTYPGALGQFIGPYMERDGFIAFMGPEKRGKSFWLMDAAYRGLLQRRKVAWFEVGDMSQSQALRRLMGRITKQPLEAGEVRVPVRVVRENGLIEVEFDERNYETPLRPAIAKKATRRLVERKGGKGLKMACFPNSSISVAGMREVLGVWEKDAWVPDIIVLDYADILDMALPGVSDARHQINETWKALRRMSQELHCLVLTATQTDAASYDAQILSRRHFSEDKRKFAHVTGMIGLNQTPDEKEDQVMRLNWILRRDGNYNESKTVVVANCLALGNPCVRSCW